MLRNFCGRFCRGLGVCFVLNIAVGELSMAKNLCVVVFVLLMCCCGVVPQEVCSVCCSLYCYSFLHR